MDRAWMRRNWWQIGVLTIAGWTGFYIAFIAPMEYSRRSISAQRSSGLGAVTGYDPNAYWARKMGGGETEVGWDPISLWQQKSWQDVFRPRPISYQHGRSRSYAMAGAMMMPYVNAEGEDENARQIVSS